MLDDLTAEMERITLAAAAGKVRSLGKWSPAQAIWHIGKLIELSFDGFPFRYRRSPKWAWLFAQVSAILRRRPFLSPMPR
jgi:hypothetical protein